jgi:sugar phosphate isomerase/epimerase
MEWKIGIRIPLSGQRIAPGLLETVRGAGFRHLGIDISDNADTGPGSDELVWLSRDLSRLDLQVVSLHTHLYPGETSFEVDPVQRARRIGRLNRGIDVLEALGGRIFVVNVGANQHKAIHGDNLLDVMLTAKALARVGESCHKRGLVLGIEAPLVRTGRKSPDETDPLDFLLQQFPSTHTGVCLELSTKASPAVGIVPLLERYAQKILQVQISGLANPWNAPPGLAWRHCFDFFQRLNYRGAFMLPVAPAVDSARVTAGVAVAALNAKRLFPDWPAGQ